MIAQRLRNIIRITAGCIVLLFGISWVYEWAALWYDYHFTGKLFLFMFPDWFLWLELLAGLLLMVLSGFVFRRRIKAGIGILAVIATFLISFFLVEQTIT
jgi:hypothetical protein